MRTSVLLSCSALVLAAVSPLSSEAAAAAPSRCSWCASVATDASLGDVASCTARCASSPRPAAEPFSRTATWSTERLCASECRRAEHVLGLLTTKFGRAAVEGRGGPDVAFCSLVGHCGDDETRSLLRARGFDAASAASDKLGGGSASSFPSAVRSRRLGGVNAAVRPTSPSSSSSLTPVVLMHGIASESPAMGDLASWIEERYPGIYVKNVEIRTLLWNGFMTSIFMSLDDQVDNMCRQLARDRNLASGFDLIGFSQGTQVTRGYVERCNAPRVRHWISLAGVNGGLFGEGMIPSIVDRALHRVPYEDWVQRTFTWAQMWKDPYDLPRYLNSSLFMADVNNDRADKNATYPSNFKDLTHMVLFFSPNDDVIRPQASGWFEFFRPGQEKEIVPLRETDGYKGDWLGLRTLDESGRLSTFRSGCLHVEHVGAACKDFVESKIMPFLGSGDNATAAAAGAVLYK